MTASPATHVDDKGDGPSGESFESGLTLAFRQLRRNPAAIVGAGFLLVLVLCALFAPLIVPYEPATIALRDKLLPPGAAHWLGTDHFGRDVLSRMIFGARVSLLVGMAVVVFTLLFGVPIGLVSGYLGGRIDNGLMRLMDALLTFPPLLLGVAVVGLLGADVLTVTIALGTVQVPILARIVRGSTLAVRQETYIKAARAQGASTWRIVLRHVLPNILSPIVVQITLVFSVAIVAEASLSFLGLGVQPPASSWGRDLSEARRYLAEAPWLFLSPTALIVFSVMAVNFLGDGLRDALDPRAWTLPEQKSGGAGP